MESALHYCVCGLDFLSYLLLLWLVSHRFAASVRVQQSADSYKEQHEGEAQLQQLMHVLAHVGLLLAATIHFILLVFSRA